MAWSWKLGRLAGIDVYVHATFVLLLVWVALQHWAAEQSAAAALGGVAFVLERDYGLTLPRWMQVELAQLVQRESEQRGGEVDSATIHRLFMDHFVTDTTPLRLDGYHLDRSEGMDRIEARLVQNNHEIVLHGSGEGAISAFVDGWMRHSGQKVNVVDYSEHALGEGTGAEAVSYVQINIDGLRIGGAAFDHDTVSASLKALLSALNRAVLHKRHAA